MRRRRRHWFLASRLSVQGFARGDRPNHYVSGFGQGVLHHGRFSGFGAPVNWIAADIVRLKDGILVEHWDVIRDEATKEQSKSGNPMFGETFPVNG